MKSPNFENAASASRKVLVSPIVKSRGRVFLELVKQNKLNISPHSSKLKKRNISRDAMSDLVEKKEDNLDELLPNVHFDPNSSPSSGILSKRKKIQDAQTPDSPPNSSASKRKRVSFNDPVSTTKEFIISEQEEKLKSIRCLVYDAAALADDIKNEDDDEDNIQKESDNVENKENESIRMEVDEKDLKMSIVDMDHNYEEPQNTDVTTSSIVEVSVQTTKPDVLIFNNKNELMDYVTTNLSIEEIFEKLTQNEERSMKRQEIIDKVLKSIDMEEMLNNVLPLPESKLTKLPAEQFENVSNVISHLSKLMNSNDRIKHKVLDLLSERHSKDFLTHALQENSTSTVCERISLSNIVNFLIHKVNVCEGAEIDAEIARMNRAIIHHLVKNTHNHHEMISDQKETHELLKLLFRNKPKIDVLDTVHEFLRELIQ